MNTNCKSCDVEVSEIGFRVASAPVQAIIGLMLKIPNNNKANKEISYCACHG